MAVSASGLATLLFLIFIGPMIYASRYVYRKLRNKQVVAQETSLKEADDGREQISSNQYLFALLGYAIGIGNIWRFPYVIGAAALVAYLVCAVFVAIPLFLYELIVGQSTRLSTIRCYETMAPRWKGVGYASGAMLFIVLSYYGQVVAYTLPYIVASCEYPLPWLENGAEDYWSNNVLGEFGEDESPQGLGGIKATLAISLFCFWVIVLLSTSFGKDVLGNITYVTVTMPVVLMLILIVRAPMLEGAGDGVKFYMGKFESSKLGDLSVWATACSQILFSLSPGFGTAISYSSYTNRKEDVYRICMITAIANTTFSVVGGFGIFSILGHVAVRENLPVEEVASRSGTGLVFVTIAEAMQHFGGLANVMSVLFFIMLLTLGLDSAFAWLETLVSYVDDFIAEQGWAKPPKWQLTVGVAVVQRGNDLLDVTDFFVGTLFLLVICCLESVMMLLDFGWERLSLALRVATYGNDRTPNGRSVFPQSLCRLDFHCTVPMVTGFLAIYNIQKVMRNPYKDYSYQILALGWTLFGCCIAIALTTVWKGEHGTLQPLRDLQEELENERQNMHALSIHVENGVEAIPPGCDKQIIHASSIDFEKGVAAITPEDNESTSSDPS